VYTATHKRKRDDGMKKNLVDLALCGENDIIILTYYDEERGGMCTAEVYPLRRIVDPIITAAIIADGKKRVQSFRVEEARNGERFLLPHHLVVGGTVLLVGEAFLREKWTVRGGLTVKNDPALATRLRHIGQEQTGISLSH